MRPQAKENKRTIQNLVHNWKKHKTKEGWLSSVCIPAVLGKGIDSGEAGKPNTIQTRVLAIAIIIAPPTETN